MRIAVAGGTGTVGTHVVDIARDRRHDVVVLARSAGVDVRTGDGLDAALDGVDALAVVTDWNEYRHPDFARMHGAMRSPIVVDGRNLYDPRLMAQRGIEYHGIGRPNLV